MKHVGEYDRKPVILLGYNKKDGKVMVLDPMSMSTHDRDWLGSIVESGFAQSRNYLYEALNREFHPQTNQYGWDYVVQRCVYTYLPAHDVKIQDIEQAEAWMGQPTYHSPNAGSDIDLGERKPSDIPEAVVPDAGYTPSGDSWLDPEVRTSDNYEYGSDLAVKNPSLPNVEIVNPSEIALLREQLESLKTIVGDFVAENRGIQKKLGGVEKSLRSLNTAVNKLQKKD